MVPSLHVVILRVLLKRELSAITTVSADVPFLIQGR